MNIVHICLCGPVTDGWNYQDNLLPKYHAKAGHSVTVVASQWVFGSDGRLQKSEAADYRNSDGVRMCRLPESKRKTWISGLKALMVRRLRRRPGGASRADYYAHAVLQRFDGLDEILKQTAPEVLFVHGCQFLNLRQVLSYCKKHPEAVLYIDNHADLVNSAGSFLSRRVLHGIFWRRYARAALKYAACFYGVSPARVDFLTQIYGIPREKAVLLAMGADDELAARAESENGGPAVRRRYEIADTDFLLVTGGKIDRFKQETLQLMKAVRNLSQELPALRLIVFGSVEEALRAEFDGLCDGKTVQYAGWVAGPQTYNYFAAADLAVFPGAHSVFWEQAAGQGIPLLLRRWPGMMHLDVGGNCIFIEKGDSEEIAEAIRRLYTDRNAYEELKEAAENLGRASFSYSKIAARSLCAGSDGRPQICFIMGPYPRPEHPVNTFTDLLACALADQGVQCRVIAPESVTESKMKKRPLPLTIRKRRTPQGNSVVIYAPRYISYSNKKLLGFNTARLTAHAYYRAVRKEYQRRGLHADALYAQFFTPCGLAAEKLGRRLGIPSYVDFGESTLNEFPFYSKRVIAQMLEGLRGIFAVSTANRNMLLESPYAAAVQSGLPPAATRPRKSRAAGAALSEKLSVVINGFDSQQFYQMDRQTARRELGFPQEAFIVAFTGHYIRRKGVLVLAEALKILPGIYSVFIGKGPLEPDCPNILHTGTVPHDQVRLYLNAADIFVLPTLHEGCCNALIEAMACGLPVVSSDRAFNDDILDESCSLRVCPEQAAEIAAAIKLLQTDAGLRARLSEGALKRAAALRIEKRAQRIRSLIFDQASE